MTFTRMAVASKELSANKLDNIVLGFVLNLADPIEQNRVESEGCSSGAKPILPGSAGYCSVPQIIDMTCWAMYCLIKSKINGVPP